MPKPDYTGLLVAGEKAMREKLYADAHGRGYEDVPLYYAFHSMLEEVDKVKAEFRKRGQIDSPVRSNFTEMRKEFADTCIFAFMGILECDRQIEKGRS